MHDVEIEFDLELFFSLILYDLRSIQTLGMSVGIPTERDVSVLACFDAFHCSILYRFVGTTISRISNIYRLGSLSLMKQKQNH